MQLSGTPLGCKRCQRDFTHKSGLDRSLIGVYAIYRDIRKEKLAKMAIRESFERLSKTWRQTIELLAATSEMRDPYTAGHQRRVAELAKAIAQEMELSSEEVDAVEMAALIHDIGKIRIPAEILSKPGRLDEAEYFLIKTHPTAGFELLKDVDFPWLVAEMVLQHHERLSGNGYPKGLKGEKILLGARIIAVADVVEAIASDRPYRRSLGIEAALREIKDHCGTLYDPQVVDACCALFERGFILPSHKHNV